MEYKHSVTLEQEKCKGCTTCLRRCPTEAIRIRDGHAVINSLQCIDCGECIRVCQHKAKRAVFDKLDELDKGKYLIALPAPSLFGQFTELNDADYVIQGLLNIGFNEVYEVARAAELVTEYTRRYMQNPRVPLPMISSACPVVVRLIKLRFPTLSRNLIPIRPPIEIAGKLARQKALREHPELTNEDICTVFISPCPAKVSWVKNAPEGHEVFVDKVVSVGETYFKLLNHMDRNDVPKAASEAGMVGLGWAASGGEATGLMNDGYLAADGIENIIQVLDEIENEHIISASFIELNACTGGCVGGAMTVENPYIARVRLQTLRRHLPVFRSKPKEEADRPAGYIPDDLIDFKPLVYAEVPQRAGLSRGESIRRMRDIESIYDELPQIDCGSCGAPTCHSFAEDVINGEASMDDCVVLMREHFKVLLQKDSKQ